MLTGVCRWLAVLGAFLALAADAGASARPNIVLILTDDQRFDTLSVMPHVQGDLVAQGITFENGFVSNPWCCPSRASILTGRYSHSTGVYSNKPPHGGVGAFDDRSTIATWLQGAGYRTAYFGKYLNKYGGRSFVPPGWSRWFALSPAGFYAYGLAVDGAYFPRAEQSVYSTDLLASGADDFIRSTEEPFLLVLAPFAPHLPATPAERHESAFPDLEPYRPSNYDEEDVSDKPPWVQAVPRWTEEQKHATDEMRRRQLQSLLAVDDAVGTIVSALEDTGRLEKTMVVFTSDNGFLWGSHRLTRKVFPYEDSIRVPFVVRYDPLVQTPRSDARFVVNVDIAPTFAELAGVRAPGAEGRSLLPLLSAPEAPGRTRFLIESLGSGKAGTTTLPSYCGVRTESHVYIVYSTGHRELYDLVVDPDQLDNLALDPAAEETLHALRIPLARRCNPPPPGLDRRHLCTVDGTAGRDPLRGTRRYDILCGRGGNDSLLPGPGPDFVYAGRGDDRIDTRDRHRDVVHCGPGRDVAFVDRRDRVARDCEVVRRG